MSKIFRNIALLLLPILLYYAVFLAFEPNNYFGLRSSTPSGVVFGAIRQYRESPTDAVILGDSRMAHFDMDELQGSTAERFSNLAFGGASLKESLDLLDWLLEDYPQIDEVMFGFSFYTLNQNYGLDRFETIERAIQNPFVYLTSLSYNLEALQNVGVVLSGGVIGGGESETKDPATYEWADYTNPKTGDTATLRTDIIAHLENMHSYNSNWQANTAQFERLLDTIERCERQGIRFVVVLPPAHPAIAQQVLQPYGIEEEMLPLIAQLSASGATVLDYEITDRPNFSEEQYYDAFHLDYERGLPAWTEMLFEAVG